MMTDHVCTFLKQMFTNAILSFCRYLQYLFQLLDCEIGHQHNNPPVFSHCDIPNLYYVTPELLTFVLM